MKIGIIVAMDKEMALLLPLIQDHAETTVNDTVFHTGRIGNHPVVAAKCGIGKVNAAVGALSMTDTFHPSLIINTGVAGGTGATQDPARVLDVVVASEVAYHDVWCGPGTIHGQVPGFPARFTSPLSPQTVAKLGAKHGLVASGDIFVDKVEDLNRILALYPDAMAVDMESAAIAQVCHRKNVPFICIRVISDTPGDQGNAAAYDAFWADAPKRTFKSLETLLSLL